MIYTTEDLITSINTRGLLPSSQSTFQDANLISLMNEEIMSSIVPDILTMREDFFLRSKDSTITNGISRYPMPDRAIGNVLKKVFLKDSTDNRQEIPRLNISDMLAFSSTGEVVGYMLEGDYVKIIPASATKPTLEQWYYERPSELVSTASCAKITAVSSVSGTTTFTVDTDLTGSLTTASFVDFLNATSPLLLWSKDVPVTAITTTTIAVATTNVDDENASLVLPGVGDYICPQFQSNIPMLPEEFHPIIVQLVVARCMEALGHMDKLQAVNAKLSEMRKSAMDMISNRVDAEPQKILNRNSILRYSGRGLSRNIVAR